MVSNTIRTMMYLRCKLFLFASLAMSGIASSDETMLRGSVAQEDYAKPNSSRQRQRQRQRQRRHLMKDVNCQLHRQDNVHEYEEGISHGYSEKRWACKFSVEESSRIGIEYVDIVDTRHLLTETPDWPPIVSGETVLELSEAVIDGDSKMHIPEDAIATVKIVDHSRESMSRKRNDTPATQGKLTALVIRIVDCNNVQPEKSLEQLREAVFEENSLKSQIEDCSYNQLEIEAFSGTTETGRSIQDGVKDLNIDYDVSLEDQNEVDLNNAVLQAVNIEIGNLSSNEDIDLVLFCLPPLPDNKAVNYHLSGTKYSFYTNEYCSSTSALMYSVGRTLGLQQSNTLSSTDEVVLYGDKTGMMGGIDKSVFSRCYNPAKGHQLGWYKDQSMKIDPLNYQSNTSRHPEFVLNGVSDYGKNSENALVVLKLEQCDLPQDYYIGFNMASGINADTPVDENKITIHRTEGEHGRSYGTSTKVAALYLGQYYTISNFNQKAGRDVVIRFVGLNEGNAITQVIDVQNSSFLMLDEFEDWHSLGIGCSNYRIEVTTDSYPEDTYWVISEIGGEGRVYARSPVYTRENITTSTTICLPHRTEYSQYKFQIFDEYGDGLVDGVSYKGFDPSGKLMFVGGPDFPFREHPIDAVVVKLDTDYNAYPATPMPTLLRPKICKNKRGTFELKQGGKKRSCNWIRQENKCDVEFDGEPLWKLCPKACGKCDA